MEVDMLSRIFIIGMLGLSLGACKIQIDVSDGGGRVESASGAYACESGQSCDIEVVDTTFDESFRAIPDEGWIFMEWRKDPGSFCGGTNRDCRLATLIIEQFTQLIPFLESDQTFYLRPRFEQIADFSEADAWLENFVASRGTYPGASMIIVDKVQGVIHKSAFGDQDEETVALLASVSKMPSVTLLMALHDDDANVDFDIQLPISDYLPWLGVWDSDITTEHLVSHRSGLPGLQYFFSREAAYAPHSCQFESTGTLLGCAEKIYTTLLPGLPGSAPNISADYGGSQWQLAGGVAETVGGASWNQLWDQYIAEPCELELSRFGNGFASVTEWDGNIDNLPGQENPNIEGGLAANLDDYAKLLSLHLNDGACGDNQVLSPESVAFMKEQRTAPGGVAGNNKPWGYGMGWWVIPAKGDGDIYLYVNDGLFGSISWIDVEREYGGLIILEDYVFTDSGDAGKTLLLELIPIIEDAIDAIR
jgi:CubicO group peptidase (beta-lactamase class C family)